MSDTPLKKGNKYLIKHNCRTSKAVISNIDHLIDVNTLQTESGERPFDKNVMGRVQMKTFSPWFVTRIEPTVKPACSS